MYATWVKSGDGQVIGLSSRLRTQAGQVVHVAGMLLAAAQLVIGIWLAIQWGPPYGSLALLSAFLHATATYLIGRSIRRLINRRRTDRERAADALANQPAR